MTHVATTPALSGRSVLVTGGARRLGAAIARRLHAAGGSVVIHCRDSVEEARHIVDELNGARAGSAGVVTGDLRDVAALPRIMASAIDCFGRLDVLVNNASSFYPTPIGTIDAAHFDDLIGTNLRAPLFLAQAAIPALRKTQGLILNMADIHGQRPLRQHAVYSAAKAGLIMLTRSLARELGPEIRVNAIAPGPVLWPEHGLDPVLQEQIVQQTALKRSGSPDDIANAAYFFAAEAQYVTGQVLAIDGGRSL
jgi:pteridine reductase